MPDRPTELTPEHALEALMQGKAAMCRAILMHLTGRADRRVIVTTEADGRHHYSFDPDEETQPGWTGYAEQEGND